MCDHAGTDHVEIYVLNAIPQMLAAFDHGAVIPIFPKGAATMFAPVEIAGKVPLKLLHHAADASGLRLEDSLMGVVRGETVVQQGYSKLPGCQPETLAIFGPVTAKFE
jgi:hypothetical protein